MQIDVQHLPDYGTQRWTYSAPHGGANDWVAWEKPAGISLVEILCVGSGSAGGAGSILVTNGGGGGASAGVARWAGSAKFLPDRLFLRVALGGPWNTVTGNGTDGSLSYVSVQPSTTAANVLLISGTLAAGGAANGDGSGFPGSPGTVATAAVCTLSSYGVVSFIAGQGGGSGTGAGSHDQTMLVMPVGAGAGGGAPTEAGGSCVGAGPLVTVPGGVGTTGGNGSSGYTLKMPFCSTGGSGGGGGVLVNGGLGGAGGIGAGGGGGGASMTGLVAGPGGRGGDGLIVIWAV